jgi:hypothetical protein
MNERIRKLADKIWAEEYWDNPATDKLLPAQLNKFAELIVKECVNICNQAILQNQDTLSKLNTDELAEKMIIHGSINQAQKLGKGIKQHFGIE